MQYIYLLLARLIRDGKVQVEIPAVDIDSLREICFAHDQELLTQLRDVLWEEEISDGEKVEIAQRILEEDEED